MRSTRSIVTAALATLVVSGLIVAGALASSSKSSKPNSMAGMNMTKSTKLTAESLRVTLDNLFAEHAVLAMNATNAGDLRLEVVPGRREDARQQLGRALEGDRVGLRHEGGQYLPERERHVARPHQRLRRLHRRNGEA